MLGTVLHESETWPIRKENEVALQWAEMRVVFSYKIEFQGKG